MLPILIAQKPYTCGQIFYSVGRPPLLHILLDRLGLQIFRFQFAIRERFPASNPLSSRVESALEQEGEKIIAMPPPGLFGRLIQNKRRLLWEKREGVDATLIVADVKFGVHSMILGAESPILQSRFQASLRKSGLWEIIIEEADIHTVWRTLMLIYLGYYSTSPCPKVATSGAFISSSHSAILTNNARHIAR